MSLFFFSLHHKRFIGPCIRFFLSEIVLTMQLQYVVVEINAAMS